MLNIEYKYFFKGCMYQITIRVWAILNGVVTIVVCVLIFGGLAFH